MVDLRLDLSWLEMRHCVLGTNHLQPFSWRLVYNGLSVHHMWGKNASRVGKKCRRLSLDNFEKHIKLVLLIMFVLCSFEVIRVTGLSILNVFSAHWYAEFTCRRGFMNLSSLRGKFRSHNAKHVFWTYSELVDVKTMTGQGGTSLKASVKQQMQRLVATTPQKIHY